MLHKYTEGRSATVHERICGQLREKELAGQISKAFAVVKRADVPAKGHVRGGTRLVAQNDTGWRCCSVRVLGARGGYMTLTREKSCSSRALQIRINN